MSEVTSPRHTFNYLDNLLPTEMVDTVDDFFKELDVATHMVEGKGKRIAARVGYHILRGTAIAVEMVVYGIFLAIKYTFLGIYYAGKFCWKAVVWIFTTMPMAAKRFFFPSAADQHSARVDASKAALQQGTFTVDHILGTADNRCYYAEQKDLMHSLLTQPVEALEKNAKPEWIECCKLMEELADGGDSTPEELNAKEARVKAIISEEKEAPVGNFAQVCETFIEAYKKEREFESKLTADAIAKDPIMLLRYPHLLMRQDVDPIVSSAPSKLKERLDFRKAAILQRAFKKKHAQEKQLLESLTKAFRKIDDNLNEKFSSLQEKQFLDRRLKFLETRIREKELDKQGAGFDYYLLKFEEFYLKQQQDLMKKTEAALTLLGKNQNEVDEINAMHVQCLNNLAKAMKTRIEKSLESENLKHCQHIPTIAEQTKKLREDLKKLVRDKTDGDVTQLLPLMRQLHALEMSMYQAGYGHSSDFTQLEETLIQYNKMLKHITLAHDIEEWKAFDSLTTPQQRDGDRLDALAKEVVCMALETKPECQIPLLLAKADSRSRYDSLGKNESAEVRRGVFRNIEAASRHFVEKMQQEYCKEFKKTLHTLSESVSHYQQGKQFGIINANDALNKAEKTESLNFKMLGDKVQTAEDLGKWYKQLQQIWISHMPQEQEKLLLGISSRAKQTAKMTECFKQWFEGVTGEKLVIEKLGIELNFDHLTVQDKSAARKEALETLKKTPKLHDFADKLRKRMEEKQNKAAQVGEIGFDAKLIMNELQTLELTPIKMKNNFVKDVDGASQQFDDLIAGLERLRASLGKPQAGKELEWSAKWVIALDDFIAKNNCRALRPYLMSQTQALIENSYDDDAEIPTDVKTIFLNSLGLDFDYTCNNERQEYLTQFLKIYFAPKENLSLTEHQRERLKQICALSLLSQEEITDILSYVQVVTHDPASEFSTALDKLSQELQSSPVGLEGVEAELVRHTFKEKGSQLPDDLKTRTQLDFYMSRGTNALSFHLIDQVYKMHGKKIHHHQAREAIERALLHAHSLYPDQTRAYILNKIDENKEDLSVNPSNLAPALYFFYTDLLRKIDPEDYFGNEDIQKNVQDFNTYLMKDPDANRLLMGLSRMIVDLSSLIAEKCSNGEAYDNEALELIRYKIAYQHLKKNSFANKIAITDFLKINSDLAESSMIQQYGYLKEFLDNPNNKDTIKKSFKKWMTAGVPVFEQFVRKELGGINDAPTFNVTNIPGFFRLSPSVVIDTVAGIVYHNGQRTVNLPAQLQNHPIVRSLGIHNYPYNWNSSTQSYDHCVQQEDGDSLPQLRVKNVKGIPVVSKNLPTTFEDQGTQFLQFVPKEDLALPIAAMHRMGIQQFWQDHEKLYGFDGDGKLVAIVQEHKKEIKDESGESDRDSYEDPESQKSYSITTVYGQYYCLDTDPEAAIKKCPLLGRLSKNFNLNEVLANKEMSEFFIPGLKLKIEKKNDDAGQEIWVCKFNGNEGEQILLDPPENTSLLMMKNLIDPAKLHEIDRAIEEASYRRDQFPSTNLSLQNKQKRMELEAAVEKQKKKRVALEQPKFMTTCADEAYQSDGVAQITALMPEGDCKNRFNNRVKSNTPLYKAYPKALKYLREVIDRANKNMKPQKEIAPLIQAYADIQQLYAGVCDKPLEAVFFDRSAGDRAETKDLTSALTLLVNQLAPTDPTKEDSKKKAPNFDLLIQEMAKYPLQGPMTPSQVALLNRARHIVMDNGDLVLAAYLAFTNYQHCLFKVKELAITPLADKKEILQKAKVAYDKALDECENLIIPQLKRKLTKDPLPRELEVLWRKVGIQAGHEMLAEDTPVQTKFVKTVNPKVAAELQVLRSKSLLQRLDAQDIIGSKPKLRKDLSQQQKELSVQFQSGSHTQVSGFLLEKMGHFSLIEFCNEFRVKSKDHSSKGLSSVEDYWKAQENDPAMYGLKRKDVEDIFKFLREEKLIIEVEGQHFGGHWRLNSARCAEDLFPAHKLRARLAPCALNQHDLQRVVDRVQAFLFRAMQSGFEFNFIDDTEEAFDKKLKAEKSVHLQKYLEADEVLKTELSKHKATMVDLKYAYVTGDYSKFLARTQDNHKEISRLSNALTCYLFHKTEVQHIENVMRAPAKGERNKIQLLQTRRNYPVDLLLQEGLKGDRRKEQIMQRAYLAFEEDYGNRCNLMQIRMFRALMLGNTSHEGIDTIQARMGFGKTALLPLLAIVRVALERIERVENRHLVRYIVPRAVLEDNTGSFNQRLSAILGKNIKQDKDFNRYQIDEEDPKTSFELAVIDLESRLHFYQETIREGNVLIQPPEVRCSMEAQDLDFSEIILKGGFDEETLALCFKAKQLLVKIRSIPSYNVFDELDDTQDFKSREVNFTRGVKVPISTETIRPLERLISYIEEHKTEDWSNKEARAKAMLFALCTDRAGKPINEESSGLESVLDYLSNPTQAINSATINLLSEKMAIGYADPNTPKTENDELIFLIRMVLLDEYILSLIRSKQPNTHYGVRFTYEKTGNRQYSLDPETHSALLISVPYEGVNNPKGLSVFDNREVAAITALRYYNSNETSFEIHPHLDFLIQQIKDDTIPTELMKHYLPDNGLDEHEAVDTLRKMARMLDRIELKKAKIAFHDKFMRLPSPAFRKFFGMAVVAPQIRSDEGCAKSDRYEQGSVNDINMGCSGTVGDTSSYFTKQAPDPAADGMLSLEIMGRENNSVIEWLEPPQAGEDYLQSIIATLLNHAKPTTRAIADIAGMCKSRDGTPETVVAELWRQLKLKPEFADLEGIPYYGKDNVKRLHLGPDVEPIPCTTEMEMAAIREGRLYFSFYKQKNCRGSDIKQSHGAHLMVTMDENVSNSDGKQTILRFRDIVTPDSGQSFSFAAMPEYKKIVIDALQAEKTRALKIENGKLEELKQKIAAKKMETDKDRKNPNLWQELETLEKGMAPLVSSCEKLNKQIDAIGEMEELQTKDIAYFLRLQEKNAEEENALTIFRKELKAHLKVAGSHLDAEILSKLPQVLTADQKERYQEFLKVRNKLTPFIEPSLKSLFEKYGHATVSWKRDDYVESELNRIRNSLTTLFAAAENVANNTANAFSITTEQGIYTKRVGKSIKAFKSRYGADKAVQISSTQSDGQNVAQAQAQAQALAQAEVVTETITETVLETQQRDAVLNMQMTKKSPENVCFDFLDDATRLAPIEKFPAVEHSIRPDLRNLYFVSPLLQTKREVSHYALRDNINVRYIFISQEEAESFKAEKEELDSKDELDGSSFANYTLIDLRAAGHSVAIEPEAILNNERIAQLPCVALRPNGVPTNFDSLQTEDLRNLKLTNVDSKQLLPKLEATYKDKGIEAFVQPEAFGVSMSMECTLTLNPTVEQDKFNFAVSTGDKEVKDTMPTNNEPLTKHLQTAYADDTATKKMVETYRILDLECKRRFPRLRELDDEYKKLETLNQKNIEEITDVKDFNFDSTMVAGLKERDTQMEKDNCPNLVTIGADAIKMCQEVTQLQTNLKTNLKKEQEVSLTTIKALQEKFDEFAKPYMIQKIEKAKEIGFNYRTEELFNTMEWDDMEAHVKKELRDEKLFANAWNNMKDKMDKAFQSGTFDANTWNSRKNQIDEALKMDEAFQKWNIVANSWNSMKNQTDKAFQTWNIVVNTWNSMKNRTDKAFQAGKFDANAWNSMKNQMDQAFQTGKFDANAWNSMKNQMEQAIQNGKFDANTWNSMKNQTDKALQYWKFDANAWNSMKNQMEQAFQAGKFDANAWNSMKNQMEQAFQTGKFDANAWNSMKDKMEQALHKYQSLQNWNLFANTWNSVKNHVDQELLNGKFDANAWNSRKDQMEQALKNGLRDYKRVSVLERVYGRIVHHVHGGSARSACGCDRKDCHSMFETTIPKLLEVIPGLQRAAANIEENERKKILIKAEIALIEQEAGPYRAALKCVERLLKTEKEIEKMLAEAGLHFNENTFFDQFKFDQVLPQTTSTVGYKTELPEYRLTIKDMGQYEKVFKGLTEAESEVRNLNQRFFEHVLKQSTQVEKRQQEVTLN